MKTNKLTCAAFAALLTAGVASAQDECATAVAVPAGMTAFDTTTATPSAELWNCASSTGGDLWFTFTATSAFGMRVELCGSTYDTALEVYDGTCGALNLIECNDDDCGLQSGIDLMQTAGTTYIIRVGGFSTSVGVGTLTITEAAPPGDECSSAFPIADGMTAFDTTGATTSPEPWPCALGGSDLWYAYTALADGTLNVETCGSLYDTALEAFEGDCGALTSLACNDDFCGLQSGLSVGVTRGETYYVRVGGFNSNTGTGTLTVSGPLPPQNCVETIFAANNGGSVGGATYMDMTLTQDVVFTGLSTNYDVAAGSPVGIEVWISPVTILGGNHADPSLWTKVGEDDGLAVSAGLDMPTAINLAAPVCLPAGFYGLALVSIGDGHRYTTGGTGFPLQYSTPDGVVTLDLGGGSNIPFSGSMFFPRVWNGELCHETLGSIGTPFCSPAVANSTGAPATISATGSDIVGDNQLVLTASSMPAGSFGFFLASMQTGSMMPPGSSGVLCLGGNDIGRGVGGRILQSDANGVMCIGSALTNIPSASMGSVAVMAGDVWYFQGWFRDAVGGVVTSNLTDAVCITYQ